jgi:L-aspartate oxidase
LHFDVVIIGSGIAGLSVALSLAPSHRVAVIAKRTSTAGASDWAQGGIAAVLDSTDAIENHVHDTLVAGAGLCDESAVRYIVEHGSSSIEWLIGQGTQFTTDHEAERGYHLTREGGHSHRRIIHSADTTGHAVLSALTQRLRAQANITLFEHYHALDLVLQESPDTQNKTCLGIRVLDVEAERLLTIYASHTVLATGGAGQVYLNTSNPITATGDGIAMAWRAGCRVANMEFVQFHPTALYRPDGGTFLISEALRGEGALLKLPDGQRFMPAYDARAELAPRDIVARAIHKEMQQHRLPYVHLDISHQPASFLNEHFPAILAACADAGIDITQQPIPVVPAAHYTCGGIVADLAGRTDVGNLYAVGEAAYSGLHGANRLASNSLLECVVMGRSAASAIDAAQSDSAHEASDEGVDAAMSIASSSREDSMAFLEDPSAVENYVAALRRIMSDHVGIVRSDQGLLEAAKGIAEIRSKVIASSCGPQTKSRDHPEYDSADQIGEQRSTLSAASIELRNLINIASIIVDSARARRESRGAHFNQDWPLALPSSQPTLLTPT